MDVVGKIIVVLPEVTGVSKAGNAWKKREYVLETQESRPRQIFFDFFGERADQFPLQVGQVVRLYFDIESREYNGKWFTSIRGWKVEDPATAAPQAAGSAAYGAPAAPANPYAAPANPYAAPAANPYGAQAYPGQMPGAVPPPPEIPAAGATDDLPF